MDQVALKHRTRGASLLRRKGLAVRDRHRKSHEITERVLTLDLLLSAHLIHLYLAHAEEVETTSLIHEVLQLKKGLAVPVIDPGNRMLSFSELTHLEAGALEEGPFGILQPRSSFQKQILYSEIDLWIIPGVAFDACGNRLGSGGGYYDRILCDVDKDVIGLAFEVQIIDHVPTESTDITVDYIVTEKRTIHCREVRYDRKNN